MGQPLDQLLTEDDYAELRERVQALLRGYASGDHRKCALTSIENDWPTLELEMPEWLDRFEAESTLEEKTVADFVLAQVVVPQPQTLTDAERYELEGMRAALKYAAATHNPYLFGRGTPEQVGAWAKGQAAVEQYNMAQREQQIAFLREQGMLLELFSDPALEIGRLRQALRNVLMLVNRAQHHERQGRAPVPDLWATLIRFCAEGGVMPSILRAEVVPEAATDTPPPPSAAQVLELLAVWVESGEAQAEAEEVDDMPAAISFDEVLDRALTELSHLAPTHLRSLAAELERVPLAGWTKLHVVDSKLYGSHPRFKSMAFIADLDVSPVLGLEFETYWKAGFLRGAKFWYSKTEAATMWQSEQNECWQETNKLWAATMWQSEQNECWQEANKLWPLVRAESLNDARAIAQAFAEESP